MDSAQEKVNAEIARSIELGIPVLWCTLAKDGIGLSGLCPHCKKKHSHGSGNRPGPVWGHRNPHCTGVDKITRKPMSDNKGYFLIDIAYRPPEQ